MENQEQHPILIEPPDNYPFNNLIQDFADEINGDDVEAIKRRFEGIIPNEMKTGRQIIDYLRQNGYISETNIIYLQQVIRILGRPSLLQKTIDFAKCSNERIPVLHFREKKIKIRTGYNAIQLHVRGHERLNNEALYDLRHTISRITLVPLEDISFAGIEETHSLIITVILPDMYCKTLQMLLLTKKKHYHFLSLRKFGVDRIKVLGSWYEICTNMESSNTEREKNVKENSDLGFESKGSKNIMSAAAKKRLHKDADPRKWHTHNKKIKPSTIDQGTRFKSKRQRTIPHTSGYYLRQYKIV